MAFRFAAHVFDTDFTGFMTEMFVGHLAAYVFAVRK